MTTEMKSAAGEVRIGLDGGDRVGIRTFNIVGDQVDVRSVPRADFLAAVAAECDAIVIPRETLPEVIPVRGRSFSVDDPSCATTHSAATAEYARERGIGYLAIAEYLDAHPPVDEAKVEALADLLIETFPGEIVNPRDRVVDRARRLLATGRIEVKP